MPELTHTIPTYPSPNQEHPIDFPEVALREPSELVPPSDPSRLRAEQLRRIIEGEIIPRLMLAHRDPARPAADALGTPELQAASIEHFASLILAGDIETACTYIEGLRGAGLSLEGLYLDLLAPTARHLGELWVADLCDFADVTLALWRLQQLVREFSPAFRDELKSRAAGRRALIVPAPGEQHTLGLFMVAEVFRRAGWDVWGDPPVSDGHLIEIVRRQRFDALGFSVGSQCRLDVLASLIGRVRRVSRNRGVVVLVGGPAFIGHPEFVAQVGADATAADARQAPAVAERLAALRSSPCSGDAHA